MQREELYNLHRTSYFTTALFRFENVRNSKRPDFNVAKVRCVFSVKNEIVTSYLIFLLFDMFIYKNKIHHMMQRGKLYELP